MPDHSNNHHAAAEELLEPYLDGLLSEEQRARFERLLADRTDLQEQVAQQRDIDDGLRRLLGPPSSESLRLAASAETRATGDVAPDVAARARRFPGLPVAFRRLGVAAALAGGVFGLWLIWQVARPSSTQLRPYDQMALRDVQAVYSDEIAAGMTPEWICKDDAEFIGAFRNRFGQGLRLGPLPAGVEALGLDYANSLTPRTMLLLARANGRPVIVFVDRAAPILVPSLPDGSGLHLHQRQVGSLILYELSPLEESRLLEAFSIPEGDG